MEPVVLKCPNCGGELSFNTSMDFGFCMYCGSKVMIPRQTPNTGGTIVSDTPRFYLFIYQKGEQTQHAIKDEVTLDVSYRQNATYSDNYPIGLKITVNGLEIPNKFKLPSSVGTGRVQISGVGDSLSISKEQKVKLNINGVEMNINNSRLYYGDLVSIGNIIFRVQPMPR